MAHRLTEETGYLRRGKHKRNQCRLKARGNPPGLTPASRRGGSMTGGAGCRHTAEGNKVELSPGALWPPPPPLICLSLLLLHDPWVPLLMEGRKSPESHLMFSLSWVTLLFYILLTDEPCRSELQPACIVTPLSVWSYRPDFSPLKFTVSFLLFLFCRFIWALLLYHSFSNKCIFSFHISNVHFYKSYRLESNLYVIYQY